MQTVQADTGIASTTSISAQSGATVATNLTNRYNDVRRDCGKPSMPAFLCRGIILRSTVPSNDYSSWNPSPHSVKSGGVSFTFLGKDAKFKNLVFGQKNGFIFYPVLSKPEGTIQIEILCAYPRDGATMLRDKPGCGAHPDAPDRSRRCQTIGISTAEQWIDNWNKDIWNMCSFDVRDSMNNLSADSFYQSIRVHNLKNMFAGSHDYTELILATWRQNIPQELPIEAFYYLPGGLAGAQHDQRDFYNKTGGKVVPIIKMTLPTATTGNATFDYFQADQAKP
ncbi:halovibrin HvnA [Pseudomonas syringae]|uniref:Halovibrin HvnA n=1 Tax=Pseudomonas syringae TaxID=317 RepID=A0A0L1MN53_PSESX|nr:halovibrin HvnA [Pseudomonas syringae]